MSEHARGFPRGDCLAPTDPALLKTPLVFIYEDHLREREICAMLDRVAANEPPGPTDLEQMLAFLGTEMPLHLEDEEQDLFPLLRRRCEPEDQIERVIARLSSDHRHSNADTPKVVAILDAIKAGGAKPDDDARSFLAEYATHARRHLVLENALILPFSRLRLTRDDLETLRLRMTRRRGLD
jgi:iron-sulfur cluster repair protein YtfE (RIC family)